MLEVHEVAIATTATLAINELTAPGFPEIGNGSEFCLNRFPCSKQNAKKEYVSQQFTILRY